MPPNRIRFVRYDPEGKVKGDGVPVNDVTDRYLNGLTVGTLIAYQAGQIGAIAAEGYGLSFYADIASIIRALLIREVYDQTVLDENSDPLLWQPTGSFDPQHQSDPISRKDGIRIVRGLREDDQPPEYVQQQLEGTDHIPADGYGAAGANAPAGRSTHECVRQRGGKEHHGRGPGTSAIHCPCAD